MNDREAQLQALRQWLENEAEKRIGDAIGRRDNARSTSNATRAEHREAKRIAERMMGRKMPAVTYESSLKDAEIQFRIADKLEAEGKQLSAWAELLGHLGEAKR